jgi:hypothetical protein
MAQFKLKKSYYKRNTPEKMRKLGDAIMISGPVLQSATMNLPLTDGQMIWINFGITIVTLGGKILTNFFADGEEDKQREEEETKQTDK